MAIASSSSDSASLDLAVRAERDPGVLARPRQRIGAGAAAVRGDGLEQHSGVVVEQSAARRANPRAVGVAVMSALRSSSSATERARCRSPTARASRTTSGAMAREAACR